MIPISIRIPYFALDWRQKANTKMVVTVSENVPTAVQTAVLNFKAPAGNRIAASPLSVERARKRYRLLLWRHAWNWHRARWYTSSRAEMDLLGRVLRSVALSRWKKSTKRCPRSVAPYTLDNALSNRLHQIKGPEVRQLIVVWSKKMLCRGIPTGLENKIGFGQP